MWYGINFDVLRIEIAFKIQPSIRGIIKDSLVFQEDGSDIPGQLLRPHPSHAPPDMSPFFLRQYVKGHARDIFHDYPQLLTEMVLRLPYQVLMCVLNKWMQWQSIVIILFDG